jgi:flagellar hook-length control protein FliK
MAALPISINNTPPAASNASAAASNSSPASSDGVNQQEEQGFSNVLARQVADSDKPVQDASSSANDSTQPEQQESAETAAINPNSNSLPADMLTALLTQQNQAAAVQSGNNIPLLQNVPQTNPEIPLQIPLQTTQLLPGSPNKTGEASELALEGAPAKPENIFKGNKGFFDAAKMPVIKEADLADSKQSPHGSLIGEAGAPTQQPSFSAALSNATPPNNQTSISTALTQAAWGEEFSQKVTWIATQHNQSAELHLNPPQLGPLDVTIKMNGDQANAIFTSPHAAVRDAIEQAIPKLREMLAESGIMLGNATVNDQAAQHQPNQAGNHSRGSTQPLSAISGTDSTSPAETRITHIKQHKGMVDTFA